MHLTGKKKNRDWMEMMQRRWEDRTFDDAAKQAPAVVIVADCGIGVGVEFGEGGGGWASEEEVGGRIVRRVDPRGSGEDEDVVEMPKGRRRIVINSLVDNRINLIVLLDE